ncbi:ECF transporter S component [Patescibacteria group bacterium]
MFLQTKTLPRILTFGEVKYYIFSLTFTAMAASVPWVMHQFHMVSQIFLPMHIFVLIAGFLFGWRTGLMVGVLSPLLSYSLTQMPAMVLLPQIVLELAIYGIVVGILREKKTNIWVSLIFAMILGRVARIIFILAFIPKIDPIQFIQISLPGIIFQLALIPFVVYLIRKFLQNKDKNAKRI